MAKSDEAKWEFLKGKNDENNPLTLLHMLMMVFKGVDPEGVGRGQRAFFNKVLSDGITKQTSVSYVTYLMQKELSDGLTKSRYDAIYTHLLGSKEKTDEDDFQSLHEQYEKLKGLGKEKPEDYAKQLWEQMGTTHSAIDESYMDIFRKRSPLLFAERGLKDVNSEQTYKLLTVAIAISLNLKTSVTTRTSDPLDKRCKKFLYAGPPEELPEFTLREIFDTLFPTKDVFAVKQSENDDYVVVKGDNLTPQDQLCILLPGLYNLHPSSDQAAKALLDNHIAEKETADRVRAFFGAFSNSADSVWKAFIAHLKVSLTQCVRAKSVAAFTTDTNKIRAALRNPLTDADIPMYSGPYQEHLCTNVTWSGIVYDKFWNSDQVDISLPGQCENEEDVQQLYQYIAAYVLIALCCLKVDDPQAPEERKIFKEKLIQKIHNPTSISVEKHEEIKQENEALKRIVAEEKRKNNEMTNMFRRLLKALLFLMHMSASVDFSEVIKGLIREVIPHCDYTQNEMAEIEAELEKPFRRFRGKDSPGWDNGGN